MKVSELRELGFLNKRGIVCGELSDADVRAKSKKGKDPVTGEKYASTALSLSLKKPSQLICHSGDVNTLLMAPTGTAKGVGVIIPSLLSIISRSVIVFDPKGENFEKTGRWRSNFSYVLKFYPTSKDTIRFNPVLEIRDGINYAFRDCDLIADIIFEQAKGGGNGDASEYFNNSAKIIVTAALLHIRFSDHQDKSFGGLRDFLAGGNDEELNELLSLAPLKPNQQDVEASGDLGKAQARAMAYTEHYFTITEQMWNENNYEKTDPTTGETIICNEYEDAGLKIGDKIHCKELDDIIKKGAAGIVKQNPKERASTWQTIAAKIRLFDDPAIRRALEASDFEINDFFKTDKPISLYLVVEPSDITRLSPIMKILITLFMKRFTTGESSFGKKLLKYDVYCILDEFPLIGNLPVVAETMGVSRSYGVFFMIVCQALNQIVDRYGQNHPYLDHCSVHIIYAPGSVNDAKFYSDSIGNETVREEKVSRSGHMKLASNNMNYSDNNLGRAYLDPADIMRIPRNSCLIRIQNEMPYIGKKVVYYQDYRFKDKLGKPLSMAELYSECRGLPSIKKYLAQIESNRKKETETVEEKAREITYVNNDLYDDDEEELVDSIIYKTAADGGKTVKDINFTFNEDTDSNEKNLDYVDPSIVDDTADVKPGAINLDALKRNKLQDDTEDDYE